VPGIKVDGRRVQGTREIARFLDQLVPEPPLFPSDPEARIAVEDAERWADEELQNTPRRIMRLQGAHSQAFRRWVAKELVGVPLPGVAAALNVTEARRIAKVVDADEPTVRRELDQLPAKVAHIDELIADGVIGGEAPNAADFQIAASMRLLLMLEGIAEAIDGGPAAEHACRSTRSPSAPSRSRGCCPRNGCRPASPHRRRTRVGPRSP
jgi:glutathione S-transferase